MEALYHHIVVVQQHPSIMNDNTQNNNTKFNGLMPVYIYIDVLCVMCSTTTGRTPRIGELI